MLISRHYSSTSELVPSAVQPVETKQRDNSFLSLFRHQGLFSSSVFCSVITVLISGVAVWVQLTCRCSWSCKCSAATGSWVCPCPHRSRREQLSGAVARRRPSGLRQDTSRTASRSCTLSAPQFGREKRKVISF